MENEIKVGDWIRTKAGHIAKIIKKENCVNKELLYTDNKNIEVFGYDYAESEVVKHSPNIIELIENGDYVNGYPVRHITDINTGEEVLCNFDLNEMRWIPLKEIDIWYEIVTHEQMKSISYKVKE